MPAPPMPPPPLVTTPSASNFTDDMLSRAVSESHDKSIGGDSSMGLEHLLPPIPLDLPAPAPKAAAKKKGVKMSVYTKWIKEELEKEEACLELPMTLTLLLAFAYMALGHLQQDTVSIVENAITADIAENANFAWAHTFGHKGIDDVNSYADYWSWTRLGFLPLLTAQWGYSEDLAGTMSSFPNYSVDALPSQRMFPGYSKVTPVRNDYLRYNRIIGGIRLRQTIADTSEDKCTFPSDSPNFRKWFAKPCSPSGTGELPPDQAEAEEFTGGERVEWILTEIGNIGQATQALVDMEDGCSSAVAQNRTCLCTWCMSQNPPAPWLNEVTTRVQISFIVMNPVHSLYSYATVNFWFNRAGHIYKLITIRSSWVSLFARPLTELALLGFADAVWFFTSLYVFCSEARELLSTIGKSKKAWYHAVAEDYMGFWNIIDWTSIVLAFTIVLLGARLQADTGMTNDILGELAVMTTGGVPTHSVLLEAVERFFDAVEAMLSSESAFRFQLVLYPSILMLRLFKSFAAQPRLAIVTETFMEARSDIFHFFIVFFSVYICMALNAVLFFGQDSVDFSTMDRAFNSCFLVMYGDWDYEAMEQIGRLKASMWFWLFMIVVVLVLQNIMLAILMEAYTNVKMKTGNSPTLFAQIKKQYRRFREARQKKRVRLNDIFDGLLDFEGGDEEEMLENNKPVYPDDVIKRVPLMNHEKGPKCDPTFQPEKARCCMCVQAARTLRDAQKDYDVKNSDPFSAATMAHNMTAVKARLDSVLVCSAFVQAKMKEADTIEMPTPGFVEGGDENPHLNKSNTVEHMGGGADNGRTPQAAAHTAVHHDDDFVQKKSRLEEGLEEIRKITQKSTVNLSDAMEAVLAEEMQGLERRQKEQQKTMEQMQASLQSLRSLAYKLSDTCAEVGTLSAQLTPVPMSEMPAGPSAPAPEVGMPATANLALGNG